MSSESPGDYKGKDKCNPSRKRNSKSNDVLNSISISHDADHNNLEAFQTLKNINLSQSNAYPDVDPIGFQEQVMNCSEITGKQRGNAPAAAILAISYGNICNQSESTSKSNILKKLIKDGEITTLHPASPKASSNLTLPEQLRSIVHPNSAQDVITDLNIVATLSNVISNIKYIKDYINNKETELRFEAQYVANIRKEIY